jgi:hypothetical protein
MELQHRDDVYVVTVVFDGGAQASIRTHVHPTIPDAIWEPGSLCWLGGDAGPMIEIHGGEVVSLAIRRQDEPATAQL